METKISSGALNVDNRASLRVTRTVDDKVCKLYGPDDWGTVSVKNGIVKVTLEGIETETWSGSVAHLVTPEAIGETKFVYVDMDEQVHEFDPETGEGPVLEECRNQTLLNESEKSEQRGDSGVVRAFLADDKHWRFAGRLTTEERQKLGLWRSPEERDAWAAAKPADKSWRVLLTYPRGNGSVIFVKAPTKERAEADARVKFPDASEFDVTEDVRDPGVTS